MEANVRVFSTDWKQHIPAKNLLEMIQFVQKACGGEAQVSDDVARGGDDSVNTVVWPMGIEFELIDEDTCWCLMMAEKVHVTNEGKLFFMFDTEKADDGAEMPRTQVWLDSEKAQIWLTGMEAFKILHCPHDQKFYEQKELDDLKGHYIAAMEVGL